MNVFDLVAKLTLDSSEYDKGLGNSEKSASTFGQKLKSGLGTATKIGVAAIGAVSTAVVATGAAMVKQTGEVAAYGDNIDKMSQKMGLSATAYQEWDAILQHSGSSIESMKMGMKTLATAAETGSDAFTALGMSQEDIANMSQEELFGETIKALQNVEDETQRTYLASKLLGRGGTELGALLNTSAEDTEKMRQRVHELGGVMSDDAVKAAAAYQDSLQDMQTSISGLKRGIISDFMPSLTTVMDGLTEIFSGNTTEGLKKLKKGVSDAIGNIKRAIPEAMKIGGSIVSALYQAIMDNLPEIAKGGTEMIVELVKGLVTNLPTIVSTAGTMVTTIVQTIWSHLPELWNAGKEAVSSLVGGIDPAALIERGGEILNNFVSAILDYLPKLLDSGIQLVEKMSDGIGKNGPQIIAAITNVLAKLITTIVKKLPQFLAKGAELITKMVQGIAQNIPTIVKSIAQMLVQLISTIVSNLPQFLAKGREIVSKMLSGLVGAQGTLISGLGSLLSKLVSAIANKLGQFLAKGREIVSRIASGITGAVSAVVSAIGSLISRAISAITGRAGQFTSQGSNIVSRIASGISGAAGRVAGAISSVVSRIRSAFSNISWSSIGSNIISGVRNGISGAAGRLASVAVSAARNAFRSMKNALGIASPSKLARDEIGKNLALGIGVGLERFMPTGDMVDTVEGAFAKIAGIPTPTISALSNVTATGGGYEPLLRDIITALQGLAGMGVYMDGKALVGQLVPSIDTALGQRVNYKERGIA